ncbi:MAG: hypothetical protein AAF404_23195, partial [Pseudomonadota bacterium]
MGRFDSNGNFIANQIDVVPGGTLSQGGSVELSVVILNSAGERVTTIEEVSFVSGCLNGSQALIVPANPVPTVNGVASTLYTVDGCAGLDEVRASLAGSGALAVATLDIAPATTNAVNFVSADPTLIVLRGTGGENRSETAEVVFQVVDETGSPLPGVSVGFDLSSFAGGLSLSETSQLSDGNGEVRVSVAAGDIATTVRVVATVEVEGEEFSTVSDLLTVTTGLPDADSISISIGTPVVGQGFSLDGVEVPVTVRMADKFNNPVVDGTAAVFTTEYGAIESTCFTEMGGCSVMWNTQDPRTPLLTGTEFLKTINDSDYSCPSHNGSSGPCPNDLGFTRGGRSTITVHAIGEESFVDQNGNGIMDEVE